MTRTTLSYLIWSVGTVFAAATTGQAPTSVVNGPAGTYNASQVLSSSGPVVLPSPWQGPAGSYTVAAPAPVTVTNSATSVTISWGDNPTPPSPNPPSPNPPAPTPTTEFEKIGQEYASMLAKALASGFEVGADALDKGAKVAEANAALTAKWDAARKASFSSKVGTELAKIVPPKTEPPDAATRAKFAEAWRGLAKGLKGQ